jgi:predicted transporter
MISPVIAPVSVSLLMIVFSILIASSIQKGNDFKPALISGILALSGIVLILYSFMHDINATLHQQIPKPYRYELLVIGDILFVAAFLIAYVKRRGNA